MKLAGDWGIFLTSTSRESTKKLEILFFIYSDTLDINIYVDI